MTRLTNSFLLINQSESPHYICFQSNLNLAYQGDQSFQNMGPYIASTIYTTMIRPITLYCYPVLLGISNTLNDKLESIQEQASRIITQSGHIQLQMDGLEAIRKRRSTVDVFKSLNYTGTLSDGEIRFEKLVHQKNTRGNGSFVKLPKVRTSFGKKSFVCQGDLIFNELDKSLRDERSLLKFKEKISEIY